MDDEEAPWRTPSRSGGADRPGNGPAAAENVASGSSSQKRKRHAKKRRRNTTNASDDASARDKNEGDRSDSSAPKEWGCPACTFLNDAARRFCEMCGTSNPTKPVADSAPSEWSCVACTMKNAPTQRVCAVCGTINPNPSMPPVLSIARNGGLFFSGGSHGLLGVGDEDDDDDDDGEGESDDGSNSSGGSSSNSDEDSDRRLECPCVECGVTIRADQTNCSSCHAPRPVPRRKLEQSDLSSRLHKLTRKIAKQDKSSKKKKNKDAASTRNAYGVSSEVLLKLMSEPKSSKLVDTLQALTHTLAMMDASADSEWGDVHHSGAGAFFVHGFGGSVVSDKGKDTALFGVLATIFRDDRTQYPPEVRLLSVQSINYILKMDRHLFKKDEALDIVRIYIGVLQKWSSASSSPRSEAQLAGKDELMIVEECVNGLCGLCGSEGAMLRELITPSALNDYLAFLEPLAAARSTHLHVSVVSNALDLFQKCCLKIKWDKLNSETNSTQVPSHAIASRIVLLLRMFLKHSLTALHVSASKCLLMLFHRSGHSSRTHSSVSGLITGDVILELVEVLTSKNPDETEESRQAAAALLIHLVDHEKELLESIIRGKIYEPLMDGIVSHLLQPSASSSLTGHLLKIVSLLIRRVCRRPVIRLHGKSRNGKDSAAGLHQNRLRLDSSPDPDVLATLLLDFIRADSIPAVSALIKDGADLNFPSIYDSNGRELEKPLVVAAEVASLSMVRFLVKRGVDVHQTGPNGTALHVAALEGRCDVVSFLLECGASPLDVDRQGRSVMKWLDEADEKENQVSPVRKLLELHQRVLPVDEDSDASEDGGGIHHRGARGWLVSGDHPYDDEDDEDDEFDDEDNYMDYDDDEIDSDEDRDEESDVEDIESSTNATEQSIPSPGDKKTKRKRRRESVASDRSEGKESKKICRTNGSSDANNSSKEISDDHEHRNSTNLSSEENDLVRLPVDEVDAFSMKVFCSLLQTLRAIDHQNVNRSVLSTLASALEMAPSALVRKISEADISLLLETVNHLLQDPAILSQRVTATSSAEDLAVTRIGSSEETISSGTMSSSASQAAQKAMLASYILALRILQAIVRKSVRESAVFYEIERRGICEQIERLHAHSSQILHPTSGSDERRQQDHSGAIFGRGLQLLDFLRSNMVESGMLHLHRLRNMTRRLRELMDTSPPELRDMVLVDLVELFEKENSITSHEFKQSDLLESILAFLVPPGNVDPVDTRVSLLLASFAKSPAAFNNLITRLQAVVNQEENLPLMSFFSGKGRELYPLTKQLKVVCARASKKSDEEEATTQKMLQLSSLTHFQSFEKTIFRCMPVKDIQLASFYYSLIGQCVHKAVDGKWKKFWVCGFDPARSMHILRTVDGGAEDYTEVVIHDSQYKLSTAIDVFEDVSVDFTVFGELIKRDSSSDTTTTADGKKRKRQSKKRRESSISSSSGAKGVEVQNVGTTNAGKMRGAWYAGELVEDSDGSGDGVDSEQMTIQAGKTYTVRLLTSGTALKDVPGDKIRVRTEEPQVGSVVEVDGLLGEVSRVNRSGGIDANDSTFDVKVSRDRERKGIAMARIRYPPSSNLAPAPTGVIKAMSLSRLFPPRESSLAVGSVGDRVWVAPASTLGSNGDFFVAGSIHSFPAGPDGVGPSAAVFVEVAFGGKTSVVKVDQSRVTNLAIGRSRLGSSRLLSALNMSSERATSGQTLHRLLHSSAGGNELLTSRSLSGSGSAIDQLRHLLSQSSSRESSLNNLLNTPSGDSMATTVSVSMDGEVDPQTNKTKEDDAASHASRVWRLIKAGEKKVFTKCVRPPRMKVLMGYERRANIDSGLDRGYEEEFGFSSGLFSSTRRVDAANRDVSLTQEDPVTKKAVFKPLVAEALSSVYLSFDPSEISFTESFGKKSKKGKKKKQKLGVKQLDDSSSTATSSVDRVSWDIDKFSAFMHTALGVSTMDDPEGTLVDNCIQFSLFASRRSRRRLLERDGLLAAIADLCKSARNARHLLAYLVSRGHRAVSLTGEDTRALHDDYSGADGHGSKPSEALNPAREIALRSFPSDQNMLRCLHELQQLKAESHDVHPPWKFKYFVRCDITIDWSNVNKRESESSSDSFDASHSTRKYHLRTISGVATTSPMMKAVRLLSYLYEASPKSLKGPDDVWRNARLANKLETQLEDVLSVCSGIYPEWCDAVVSQCKFFFPRQLREKLFQATSFGCTRSLHWFKGQLNVDDAGGSSNNAANESLSNGPGIASDGIYNHEITISPIPKERVKVNRENLLNSAEAIMKMHGKRKAILDIVFIGEKGYGSGVTAAFYSATAHALQSVVENRKDGMRLWVPGIEDEREDETIRHPNGLFPFPHMNGVNTNLVERFRMMGRLAGKALMDSRLFPLPLSVQFMKLVLGQRVCVEELDRVFLNHGKILWNMKHVADQLEAGVNAAIIKIDGMAAAKWLEAASFTFVDPLSQQPLEPRGDDKEVTLANLKAYVDKVLALWLHEGIHAQVQAFREGISDVLSLEKLNLLFVDELLALLCGDADIAWDVESLSATMKLAHGYTKDSKPVEFFVQALAEMSVPERREFLLYATGCPNLPAGGFASLRPPFEVVRRVVDTDDVDQALPFARTCTNTLHLPAYSSQRVLDERLRYAIANSAGVIDRD